MVEKIADKFTDNAEYFLAADLLVAFVMYLKW